MLSLPDDAISIGSRTLANLLIYWLDGGHLPVGMGDAIYAGMREDLHARGKAIQTEQDEHAMKTRWVKQLIHREFDIVREAWLKEQPEAPVGLEVLGAIDEAEHGSITKETEEAAQAILDEFHEDPSEPRKAAEAEGAPRPMPSGAPQETDQASRDWPI